MTEPHILRTLIGMLETAVPLWYAQLGLPDTLSTVLSSGEVGEIARTIAQKCDLVLHGPAKGTKIGEVAEAFNALARGIAIASALPGGYTIAGIRWENGRSRAFDGDAPIDGGVMHPKVWEWALAKARGNKAWAEQFSSDPEQVARAGDWTKQTAERYNGASVEELARQAYDYLRHRASLRTVMGHAIDRTAYDTWMELTSQGGA